MADVSTPSIGQRPCLQLAHAGLHHCQLVKWRSGALWLAGAAALASTAAVTLRHCFLAAQERLLGPAQATMLWQPRAQ